MSDARDQINLAAWMERRMDAIGPYGPHILDGVRRYEARIAHHDDVVRELVAAAQRLVNNPGWGTARYTDDGMWADGEALRAALAKIA